MKKSQNQTQNIPAVQPQPTDYLIPQTVTSPIERREIRNFLQLRVNQIKARLDRIYSYEKERFVESQYEKRLKELETLTPLSKLLNAYNQPNDRLKQLQEQKDQIDDEIRLHCEKKHEISMKLKKYCNNNDGLAYSAPSSYGGVVSSHQDETLDVIDVVNEVGIIDQLKAEYDDMHSQRMSHRNQKLAFLNEKIEERLLFGNRDQIQELFCKLETMNQAVERELMESGIEQPPVTLEEE